jgi:hypothetical protein
VINDNGGTATVADFNVTTSAGALVFDAGSTAGNTTTYTAITLTNLTAGVVYSLSEANVAGYREGSWSCLPNIGGGHYNNGSVTLAAGEAVVCTISNNDVSQSNVIFKDSFGLE